MKGDWAEQAGQSTTRNQDSKYLRFEPRVSRRPLWLLASLLAWRLALRVMRDPVIRAMVEGGVGVHTCGPLLHALLLGLFWMKLMRLQW